MRRNYLTQTFLITALVVLALVALGRIPAGKVWGVRIKRIDIFSDLRTAGTDRTGFDTLASLRVSAAGAEIPRIGHVADRGSRRNFVALSVVADTLRRSAGTLWRGVPVEDYSPGGDALGRFFAALNTEPAVRVAVFGDSFIEGDIFTCDLRESLQEEYGGAGVGFVPFALPVPRVRETVRHTFSGWQVYNLMQQRAAPEALRGCFSSIGTFSVPSDGARTTVRGTDFRRGLAVWQRTTLLLVDHDGARISVTVNDSVDHTFIFEGAPHLNALAIPGQASSVDIRIGDPGRFAGLGVLLDGTGGVSVDAFPVRGNNGGGLLTTSAELDSQLASTLDYRLIILEYGQNAISDGVVGYRAYGDKLVEVIARVRTLFPRSDILLMGIGDRGTLVEGEFTTMPAVEGMVEAQRRAAQRAGVAFWNTYRAMGGRGSMVEYVDRGLAAKDYTHLSYGGGRILGRKLASALIAAKRAADNANTPE